MFSVILKTLRIEKGYSQKELSQQLGLSANCICEYEKGRSEPNMETLKKLSLIFECSIDYLVGHSDDFGNVQNASESSLSKDETDLLFLFRQLPDTRKKTILDTMSDMVSARRLSSQNIS